MLIFNYEILGGGEYVNERVLALRKELNLTQEAFGKRLGVRKTAISKIEKGENNLTEPMIKLICSEFNVNEEYLRTGKGDPFISSETFSLDDYARKNNLTALELDIIKGYIELDNQTRATLVSHFKSIFDKHSEVAATVETYDDPIIDKEWEAIDDIDEEVERYRLELEAEKKGIISSAFAGLKGRQAK